MHLKLLERCEFVIDQNSDSEVVLSPREIFKIYFELSQ